MTTKPPIPYIYIEGMETMPLTEVEGYYYSLFTNREKAKFRKAKRKWYEMARTISRLQLKYGVMK